MKKNLLLIWNKYKEKVKESNLIREITYKNVKEVYDDICFKINDIKKFRDSKYISKELRRRKKYIIKNINNESKEINISQIKSIEINYLIDECLLYSGQDNLKIQNNIILYKIIPIKLCFLISQIRYKIAYYNYHLKIYFWNLFRKIRVIYIEYKKKEKNLAIGNEKKPRDQLEFHIENRYLKKIDQTRQIFVKEIFHNIEMPKTDYFFVKSSYCLSSAAKYITHGNEPLYKTALELIKNKKIDFKDSYIFKHYQNFKPRYYGELINLRKENKFYKLPVNYIFKPWAFTKPQSNILSGIYGPQDISIAEMRFYKIRNLILNILEKGYIPSYSNLVSGYLFKRKSEYRFIVLQGWHRLAVLQALNKNNPSTFNFIPVKYDLHRINLKQAEFIEPENWPAVSAGHISLLDALEIANKFFDYQ